MFEGLDPWMESPLLIYVNDDRSRLARFYKIALAETIALSRSRALPALRKSFVGVPTLNPRCSSDQ